MEDTVARILDHVGEIVTSPFPEGLLTVATFRDPAGNLIGLWNDTTRPHRPGRKSQFGDTDAPPGTASEAMLPSIQPELWVEKANTAVAFYQEAFGAIVMHQVGDGDDIAAQLSVNGASFWLTEASASMKRLSSRAIDGTTSRTLLVVKDPEQIIQQAVAAGAIEISPLAMSMAGALAESSIHSATSGRLDTLSGPGPQPERRHLPRQDRALHRSAPDFPNAARPVSSPDYCFRAPTALAASLGDRAKAHHPAVPWLHDPHVKRAR